MTVRALVVGLGQIGMGYDLELDPNAFVLTHARAFQRHPAYELVGGVDLDMQRRRTFEEHYGVRSYADVLGAMHALRPDVVAVATPSAVHADTVREILRSGSRVTILCEKPLAHDVDAGRALVHDCQRSGGHLYVNYIRRSEPGAANIKQRFNAGQIGQPVKGVVWYSKGLFNNGSHFLNLLQDWLGDVREHLLVSPGRKWDGIDPEPDVKFWFARGEVCFLSAAEENFSHCTIELIATNGRLRYERGGQSILWQPTATDPAYQNYTVLDAATESIPTDFTRTQWHVVDQLAAALAGREARLCSGLDALRTLESLISIWTTS